MKIPIEARITLTKKGEVINQEYTLVNLEDILTRDNFNMFCLLFFGMDAQSLYQKCFDENLELINSQHKAKRNCSKR